MVAKLRGNDHVFTRGHCSTCVVTRQHLLEFQIIHESFSFPLFSKGAAVLASWTATFQTTRSSIYKNPKIFFLNNRNFPTLEKNNLGVSSFHYKDAWYPIKKK